MTVGDLLPHVRDWVPVIIGAVFVSLIIYVWMYLSDMRARDINIETEPPEDMPLVQHRMPPILERLPTRRDEKGFPVEFLDQIPCNGNWEFVYKEYKESKKTDTAHRVRFNDGYRGPDFVLLQFSDGYLVPDGNRATVPWNYYDLMFEKHGKCIAKFRVYINKTC